MQRRSSAIPTVCQGLEWVPVIRDACSRPWGWPESPGKEQGREGILGEDGELLRVPLLRPVLPSFEVRLIPKKSFFYLSDESLCVEIQAW